MKVLSRLVWGSAKFWLGAIVIVAAGLALARDAAPTHAASTEILASLTSGSPTWASTALVIVGGGGLAGNTPCVPGDNDYTTICLYIWAKDVSNANGASSFNVDFTYPDDKITMSALTESRTWLASTGRSVGCAGSSNPTPGVGYVECHTFFNQCCWAMGSGLLATVALSSKSTVGFTTLDFSSSFLGQTLCVCDPTVIPGVTERSTLLFVAPCADFTGDGQVRAADILSVAQKYHTSDPGADLDGNGTVTSIDILVAAKEYNAHCNR